MGNRAGAANHLNPEHRVFVNISRRRQFCDHVRPVRIHLVSKDHRQRSLHALTKLKTIHSYQNFPIRSKVNERVGRIDFRRLRLISLLH